MEDKDKYKRYNDFKDYVKEIFKFDTVLSFLALLLFFIFLATIYTTIDYFFFEANWLFDQGNNYEEAWLAVVGSVLSFALFPLIAMPCILFIGFIGGILPELITIRFNEMHKGWKRVHKFIVFSLVCWYLVVNFSELPGNLVGKIFFAWFFSLIFIIIPYSILLRLFLWFKDGFKVEK